MDFYRCDDRQPSQIRDKSGIEAWQPMSAAQAYSFLMSEATGTRKPIDFTNSLRVQTCPKAVATSRITDAGFEQRAYFYVITIPDDILQLRRITSTGIEAAPLREADLEDLNQFSGFVVFDAPTIAEAEVIGYGHGRSTVGEVTFLTTIPLKYVRGYKPGGPRLNHAVPYIPVAKPG